MIETIIDRELQRAVYIWRMSRFKDHVKDETKEQHLAAVVEACRAVVEAAS